MRPTTHELVLPGGRLVLPLTYLALAALARVPANPLKPEAGCVDPGKVIMGQQDRGIATMLEVIHAAAGHASPGLETLFTWGKQAQVMDEVVKYFVAVLKAMGPETKPEEASPKA